MADRFEAKCQEAKWRLLPEGWPFKLPEYKRAGTYALTI